MIKKKHPLLTSPKKHLITSPNNGKENMIRRHHIPFPKLDLKKTNVNIGKNKKSSSRKSLQVLTSLSSTKPPTPRDKLRRKLENTKHVFRKRFEENKKEVITTSLSNIKPPTPRDKLCRKLENTKQVFRKRLEENKKKLRKQIGYQRRRNTIGHYENIYHDSQIQIPLNNKNANRAPTTRMLDLR